MSGRAAVAGTNTLSRWGAWCGVVAVAGNVLGVALLRPVPSAYRPGAIQQWVEEMLAAPGHVAGSAAAFVAGLMALAGWALVLTIQLRATVADRRDDPLVIAGGASIAVGALFNAAGCIGPLVVAWHLAPVCGTTPGCVPAGIALAGVSLALDSLFNAMLAAGLLALAVYVRRHHRERSRLWWLALLAGLASLPVGLEAVSDSAARLLVVAGPLWLAFIAVTSLQLWRRMP